MTDPFANHLGDRISERFAMMVSMPPNSTPELWKRLSGEVAKLEVDADALLAVVRAVNAGVDICGVCGGFMPVDGHAETCEYAALPEHLR